MSHNIEENVSRESLEQLHAYDALLHKWQKTINLVSRNTLHESWDRHVLDSVQMAQYVSRESRTLYDLGSGAGFPGLVLAILRPDLDVHLIESDLRKCSFLKAVSRETGASVTVHNSRIEAVDLPSPDVVTARALASLDKLVGFCKPWERKGLQGLFLKGETYQSEIDEVNKSHDVECDTLPSKTSFSSAIVEVKWH